MSDGEVVIRPIGVFHTDAVYPYDVPRQGVLAGENVGVVKLESGCGYEQALEDLSGFSHIWLLFLFHRNQGWHAKVQPPRHVSRKVGVFASRSPYRPNGIGMSVVRLLEVRGLEVTVAGHDLLDGTPVIDIKPYLTYADSFPEATPGWTGEDGGAELTVVFAEAAERRLEWLESHGVVRLRSFALTHLAAEPLNAARHRLVSWEGGHALAYRTWRLPFMVADQTVTVTDVVSGYTVADLSDEVDKYGDKLLHKRYIEEFKP